MEAGNRIIAKSRIEGCTRNPENIRKVLRKFRPQISSRIQLSSWFLNDLYSRSVISHDIKTRLQFFMSRGESAEAFDIILDIIGKAPGRFTDFCKCLENSEQPEAINFILTKLENADAESAVPVRQGHSGIHSSDHHTRTKNPFSGRSEMQWPHPSRVPATATLYTVKEQSARSLRDGMAALLKTGYYDGIIELDGKQLPYHKLALAATSEKCRRLLTEDAGVEVFEGLRAAGVEEVLRYVYSGNIDLSAENLEPVLQAARRLGYPAVTEVCRKYMLDTLDAAVCRKYVTVAGEYNLPDIREAAMKLTR